MLYEHENPEAASHAFMRTFAESLVKSLGYDDALQICRDNSWDGIFDLLLDEPVTRWN